MLIMFYIFPKIETNRKQKRVKSMPNFKTVSKTSHYTKLLVGDKMHITNMIKEFKTTDARFADMSAAIRYYVHVGIAAETATSDIRNSLDNTIVKASQKEAVRKELIPLDNKIENLITAIRETAAENSSFFTDVARRTEIVEAKLDRNIERIDNGFDSVINFLKGMLITGEQTLRNLIVLRSIIYVFFLGHKTGRIEPGKENVTKWTRMISLAHEKANEFSITEVKMLSSEVLETTTIQKMAREIFKEVNSLPEPITE